MLIKKILVPIDGSRHSDVALDYAIDLAEKYSAEIKLLSVAQPLESIEPKFIIQPMLPPVSTVTYTKEIKNSHKKMLTETIKKVKKIQPKIKITKQLAIGRPADKIVETADKENFDLIVIGSRGMGGIKKFFLGSVSDRVADEAKCRILIVKKH